MPRPLLASLHPCTRVCCVGVLALAACETGTTGTASGVRITDHFQLEDPEGRVWRFEATEPTVPYRIEVVQQPEAEVLEDASRIWTLDVVAKCFNSTGACGDVDGDGTDQDITNTVIETWRWRTSQRGLFVHQMGDDVYDPPVQLSQTNGKVGDAWTSETGGVTFTTTFTSYDACPGTKFQPDPNDPRSQAVDCVRLDVDDAGAGTELAGTWYGVGGTGFVYFTRTAEDGLVWELRSASTD